MTELLRTQTPPAPIVGEMRVLYHSEDERELQVFTGAEWLTFNKPTYEQLLQENQELKQQIQQLKGEL